MNDILEKIDSTLRKGSTKTIDENNSIDSDVQKIAKMTDRNDHIGAALYLAKNILKSKKYTKIMEGIIQIFNVENHMPTLLDKYNYSILKQMWDLTKKEFSEEDYKKIYNAF